MTDRVLDVPALLDIATGRSQWMRARWHVSRETASALVIPWCVIAETGRLLPASGRVLLQTALTAPMVVVSHADTASALACAQMSIDKGSGWDAAQLVLEANRRDCPVITDEEHLDRLLRLDPYLGFERIP